MATALSVVQADAAEPPILQPELFAPGVVSAPDRHEFGVALTADGSEVFFGVDAGKLNEIWHVRKEGDGWGEAKPLLRDPIFSFNDPSLDPTEQRLYFNSTLEPPGTTRAEQPRAKTQQNSSADSPDRTTDLWYMERRGEGWSEPIHTGPEINSPAHEFYSSFTDDGTLYFASNVGASRQGNYDIYASRNALSKPEKPVRLGSGVNSGAYEADAFVAPDGSYLIFAAGRRSNLGRGDLYISFRGADGTFDEAVNMGPPVNTENHELCPWVSRDGKYFYYTSNQDIYRIDAAILETYRPTVQQP